MADDSGRVDRKVTGMTESNEQGPGQQLRTARELLGVSPREVADVLNLPLRVITALEADDYDGMSPTVFTRGYLRSYARLLELNADDLLAQYPQVQREPEPVDESVVVSNWRRPELLRAAGIAAALVVLLAIIVVLVVDGDEDVDGGVDRGADTRVPAAVIDPPTTAADSSGARVDVAEPTSSAVQTETQTPTVVQMPVDAGTSEPAAQNVAPVEPVAVPDLSEPESAPVADRHAAATDPRQAPVPVPAGARRITDTGDDVLLFTFDEECWVEVKTLEGVNLYSDLNRARRSLELVGEGPFRVLIGYAPGVTLHFNDEPVQLTSHTRNNVASLVVGQ